MKMRASSEKRATSRVGQEVIGSLKEAIAWASGEDIPVRVTSPQKSRLESGTLTKQNGVSRRGALQVENYRW
jgi:hypothetical protein